MPSPIAMPKPGQFTEECTIVKWLKREGDRVAPGDILFEIETDKANMEVESFFEGTLLKILTPVGGTVPVQTVVAWVGQPGEALPVTAAVEVRSQKSEVSQPKTNVKPSPAAAPASAVAPVSGSPAAAPIAPAAPPFAPQRLRISPRARALAERRVIDPTPIRGTGPGGRIVEKDVCAYLAAHGYAQIKITPAAREMAAREKLDLLTLRGTGEGGRINVADIQRAVAEQPKAMSKMRQVIAQRLTQSFTSTPHFFVTVAVDMTALVAFRTGLKARGLPYTVTDFIALAVAQSLREFPAVNSSTDGHSIRWHSRIHLGLAVSLDSGLVVPVLPDAGELTLAEVHDRAAALFEKARAGKLLPDEMTGSTFTISNMGMLNVENFTAIINPGEAAILAVSSTVKEPVVRNDQIVIRAMMRMTLAGDHRIVDGALAAQFVNAIKAKLESIALWEKMV
ncbi:MAG: dihydrolipoamide acetyltransferase family protein [Kiritimatiellaeota bacterium]|nr:dihydrolipoamide acetyltransferase family protein [Kiritimatiellota bacterium]